MTDEEKQLLLKGAPSLYIPNKLPIDTFSLINSELLKLLSKANKAIGEYTGFLLNIPNPNLLLAPITTQEAVLSSKLEGTHATLEDILNHEAGNKTNIEDDEIKEILNYRHALVYALENISIMSELGDKESKSPLTVKIIQEMHKILLDNVRGAAKHPGQLKISQNYIGGSQHISFTPLPATLTLEYMSNLERYIHHEEVDILLQAAIIHAQFEMIHPFEDGNGRIGRLLIPLFLYYSGLIPLPIFYMSSFFENDRSLYIDKLSNISKKGEWFEWIFYFLSGVIIQAKLNTLKAREILNLYDEFKHHSDEIKSYYYIAILDFIFQHPIFTAKQLAQSVQASKQTIYTVLNKMLDLKLISSTDNTKNKTFLCEKLIDIVDYQIS